jgi:thiol-disulfide isomerase/thioredoxin
VNSTGALVVVAVLLLGTAAGLWRRRTDGRLRRVATPQPARAGSPTAPRSPINHHSATEPGNVTDPVTATDPPSATTGVVPAAQLGDGGETAADPSAQGQRIDAELLTRLGVQPATATLLQFSSAFCSPCRAVRRISSEVAAMLPGVQHVEVDAESHLEAVRALGIWRTPTLLVLDGDGRVTRRATGVPGKPQLIAALGEILPASIP